LNADIAGPDHSAIREAAMIYVVDIVGPIGGKAAKEYEATSIGTAVRLAQLELRGYPECQITDIRLKRD
jgi:hypothetical protein